MNPKHTNNGPLPFPAWMEKHYPRKTAGRSLLKMIGLLDAAYLVYRLQNNGKSEVVSEKPEQAVAAPLIKKEKTPVAKTGKESPKKEVKPRVKKAVTPKIEPELSIEFEHKPEPILQRMTEPAPDLLIEPEPLVLNEEPVVEKSEKAPAVKKHTKTVWLDDAQLEEVDLRKTDAHLGMKDITVAFDTAYTDDEDETFLVVNDVSWRVMLTSPALNLSKMVQILRVSYGELYILGRMALGAMSGSGYITASDAAGIVQKLAQAEGATVELDVRYYDKDSTSKKRVAQTIHIRFERA